MNTYWLYALATGVFSGRTISSNMQGDDLTWFIENSTPSGFGARDGVTDWQSQRVEVEAAFALIDYQPPSPEPTEHYDWNATTKRWELNATGIAYQASAADMVLAQEQVDAIAQSKQRQLWQFVIGGATDPTLALELQAAYDEMQSIAVAAGLWPEE